MDVSFNKTNLARCLAPKDFYTYSELQTAEGLEGVLKAAHEVATSCFDSGIPIVTYTKNGKTTFSVKSLPHKLVLRWCGEVTKRITRARLKSRTTIIKELKTFLREGTRYRIYKLDITSFFESCNRETVVLNLAKRDGSSHLVKLVDTFLTKFNELHGDGLPRGVEISPVLAESYLQEFDRQVLKHDDVIFYSRFVDDLIILTTSHESEKSFYKFLISILPSGLNFNFHKKDVILVKEIEATTPPALPSAHTLEYLGYKLTITDPVVNKKKARSEFREVRIELSVKKQNRLLQKIYKSFLAFSNDGDFNVLRERLFFLASNRDLVNKAKFRKIPTGIYYNYSELDFPNDSLTQIDQILRNIVLHPRGRLRGKVLLNSGQQAELLKISFSKGFEKRVFKKYSPNTLQKIARIW